MIKSFLVVSNGIKDTNLKANHNLPLVAILILMVVSNGIKDTNLKANHNIPTQSVSWIFVVSNGIKDTNLKANHNLVVCLALLVMLFPMVSKILI